MDSRLERLKRDLESAVDGWSTEQLLWHPPQKWCAAEVLEHLLLTYSGTIKGFERVIASGRPLATKGSVRQRVLTFMVVQLRHIPSGFEAPAMVRPKGLPVAVVRSEIGPKLAAMDAIIAHC